MLVKWLLVGSRAPGKAETCRAHGFPGAGFVQSGLADGCKTQVDFGFCCHLQYNEQFHPFFARNNMLRIFFTHPFE